MKVGLEATNILRVIFDIFIVDIPFSDVKIGTVLFSEMPYSSVLLPEHSASHCHHCYKQFRVAIPCLKVTFNFSIIKKAQNIPKIY